MALSKKEGRKILTNVGGTAIQMLYDEIRKLSEGRAVVRRGSKWGYIDEEGHEICEIKYDSAGDFQNGLGVVELGGKKFYLNREGKEVAVTNFIGQEMVFEGCKSCAIGNHTITNLPGGYLYEDEVLNVTIDPEVPIKGFVVIGIRKHVSSTTKLTREERIRIEDVTNKVKLALEQLGAKEILLFEDGFSEHYRRWIIPAEDWMFEFGRGKNLREITSYAKQHMTMDQRLEFIAFAAKIKEIMGAD